MAHITYDFSESVIIVTGGSSGIGREIAIHFGDAGATVINADIRAESKNEDTDVPTHEAIENDGGTSRFIETDVSDADQITTVIEAARELGGVDIMVNNAGILNGNSLLECTPDEIQSLLAVNVAGVLFGCQAAAKDMIDRNAPGTIINMASIRSSFAARNQIGYGTSKGAVRMITRYAAFELAEHDIRVNAVAPGPIATTIRSDIDAEKIREKVADDIYTKPIPLGRAGEPEEVAAATLFLASDAASYTTGELLHTDGGYQTF